MGQMMADEMKPGDWINLVTAFGAVGTGLIGVCSFLLLRRQARIVAPVLNWSYSATSTNEYEYLNLFIPGTERERFFISGVKVRRPWSLRVATVIKSFDEAGGWQTSGFGKWEKKIRFDDDRARSVEFIYKAAPGSRVSMWVAISLKSDVRITSRQLIRPKMPA